MISSNEKARGMENKTQGRVIIVVIVASIIAVAGLLAYLLFGGVAVDDPRGPVTRTPEQTQGSTPPRPNTQTGTLGAEETEAEAPALDEAQIMENARAAARAVNDGNDPIPCESVCDCPQGWDCQMGSQLCIPSPFATYCCEKDGCPEGEACRHEDGRYGSCAAP